ncbi:MAG: oxygen-insensitive NADPH nitroreductase [Proteobacteria bacterium]|nr:oxygen-insensitive NADPH nitroreductase [Pseudomonadota bacterium]
MKTVLELLKSHRSIRSYSEKPIPENLLFDILSAGQSAATTNNNQSLSIIRVTDMKIRESLCQVGGGQSYIKNAPEFFVFCADLNRSYACCDMHEKEPVSGMTEQFIIATVDTSLVAQNVGIAAESSGLGICYIGAMRNDPARVCELLALPEHVYPVFGMCMGFPNQNPEVKPRLPLASIVRENSYNLDNEKELIEKYDETLNSYHQGRSENTKTVIWSEVMSKLLAKESRPHMKEFLLNRGFKMR